MDKERDSPSGSVDKSENQKRRKKNSVRKKEKGFCHINHDNSSNSLSRQCEDTCNELHIEDMHDIKFNRLMFNDKKLDKKMMNKKVKKKSSDTEAQ